MAARIEKADIRTAAQRLAEINAASEPGIKEIYLFPHAEEIRLVEVDSSALPDKQIVPFYFAPDPFDQIPYRFAIAMIRPEETGHLAPPRGWGKWEDAELIWSRE